MPPQPKAPTTPTQIPIHSLVPTNTTSGQKTPVVMETSQKQKHSKSSRISEIVYIPKNKPSFTDGIEFFGVLKRDNVFFF